MDVADTIKQLEKKLIDKKKKLGGKEIQKKWMLEKLILTLYFIPIK